MPQGTVEKVIADKGFGFIAGERGELFFHHSSLGGSSYRDSPRRPVGDLRRRTRPQGPARRKRPPGVVVSVNS